MSPAHTGHVSPGEPDDGPVPAIRAAGVEKSFGSVSVLRRLDLSVRAGEVVAIFGPNGAGKTTLMRVLTTLSRPDYGTVSIFGRDIAKEGEAARLAMGAVLHSPMLYADMTVYENLAFFGRMCRVSRLDERVRTLAERLGLTPRLEQRVRQLSHGYQKRAALARALLHEPRLLLLDEAETGLDETARAVLEGVVRDLRTAGRSVVMTTHSVERGIDQSDRVLVLGGGRFVLDQPSSAVSARDVTGLYDGWAE